MVGEMRVHYQRQAWATRLLCCSCRCDSEPSSEKVQQIKSSFMRLSVTMQRRAWDWKIRQQVDSMAVPYWNDAKELAVTSTVSQSQRSSCVTWDAVPHIQWFSQPVFEPSVGCASILLDLEEVGATDPLC